MHVCMCGYVCMHASLVCTVVYIVRQKCPKNNHWADHTKNGLAQTFKVIVDMFFEEGTSGTNHVDRYKQRDPVE